LGRRGHGQKYDFLYGKSSFPTESVISSRWKPMRRVGSASARRLLRSAA
jgi:hypothetical protein